MKPFRLEGGFTEGELDRIYGETLQLLERVGVEVGDEEIREYLVRQPGIRVRRDRVCLTRALVEEWIEVIRGNNLEYSYNRGDGRVRMVGPYMALRFRDPATGEQRLASLDDAQFAVKLCDAYDMYGPSPLHLQSVPPPIRQLATFLTCVENSREIGGWAPAATAKEGQWMCRIGEAARRPVPHCCLEIPISPLRLNVEALRMIFERRGREDQLTGMVLGGGAVPLAGATAPLFVPGCYIQGMAEALGAYIVPQLIDPRVQGYCSFGGFLFNLKDATTTPLFPESVIYMALARQVIQRFLGETLGTSVRAGDLTSLSVTVGTGFQAAVDILGGARTFLGIGCCPGDTFCPVNAVVQADLVRHFERFMAGRTYRDEPELTLRTIEEALHEQSYFLIHPTTLEFRDIYLNPELVFKHDDPGELTEAAREKAHDLVARHRYALPEDVSRDVQDVYQAARRDLLGEG